MRTTYCTNETQLITPKNETQLITPKIKHNIYFLNKYVFFNK